MDLETHAQLKQLSEERGESIIDTIRAAAHELQKKRFLEQSARELERLRQDPVAWADYIAEGESTYVADGID